MCTRLGGCALLGSYDALDRTRTARRLTGPFTYGGVTVATRKLRRALIVIAGGLGCFGIAFAQEQATQQLEELVVTATRRAENVQTVPIAVTALTSNDLAVAQIQGIPDLPFRTPGLQVAARSVAWVPYIRGIGTLDISAGQESAIATYIDGVYLASIFNATFLSFNNIERIEVLKGPQGTLFGRNATGGAIQIITRTPSQTPSLDASVSYGNYEDVRGQLYATGGLGPLAADVALTYQNQGEGYGVNVFNGERTEPTHEFGVRSKWLFIVNDATKITLSGDYGHRSSGIGDNRAIMPGSVSVGGFTAQPVYQNVNLNFPSDHFIESWGTYLQIQHSSDLFDFNSLTSYRKMHGHLSIDNDGIPISVVEVVQWLENKTISQEFQFISPSTSRVRWILGAYYLNDFNGYIPPGGLLLSGAAFPVPSVGFMDPISTESYAVYGETTFNLASDTRLTLGARWTHDQKKMSGSQGIFASNGTPLQTYPGPLIASIPIGPYSSTYSKPTWRISLDHNLEKNIMVYASYNRGYRSGTFNTVVPTNGGTPVVQPETNDSFEIGEKADLLDRRLQLNTAAFYTMYKNLQVTIPLGPTQAVQNGKVKSYGLEIEAQAAVTSGFRVSAGLALLHATFEEFGGAAGAPCTTRDAAGMTVGYNCDVVGNYLPRAPKITFNAGVDYSIPTEIGTFGTNLYYLLTDKFYWEPDNRLSQSPYGLLNGQLYWTDKSGHYTVALWGQNLTDVQHSAFSIAQAGLNDQYAPAAPLTWGASIRVNF